MSLDNYKITQNDIETKGVVAAPNVLSGGAQENKAIFDRLIREAVAVQFNAVVDALTASSGAGEIGAAVDGIAAGTVLGVLSALKVLHDTTEQTQGVTNESVQAALGNRYTKDQTDALLQGKLDTVTANQMVRAIEFNAETGVFTITTQGGAVSTIDTMLERVPASFTLENNQLVLTLEDGTRQTADLSAFIDTYTFSSGDTVAFSQSGKTITAEVRDGSLALSKLTPEAQVTLASYASRAETAQEGAEAARAGAEAARDAAQRAAATAEEKASAAAGSASTAGNHASAAAGSATAAEQSETNAKDSETAAKAAQDAAEKARDEAQAVAGGDFLPLAGGTLTGKLTLDGAPSADLHAATKKYVDDAVPETIAPAKLSSPVPIGKGGTGADSAADARANLGAEKVGAAQRVFDKIISKKDQLIVNGSASLADNTGISALQFDGSQAYYSRGSFTYEHGKLAYFFSDDFFEIDPRKTYEFSFDLKSKNGVAKMYSFLTFFDADHNEIWQQNYYFRTGSTTKLARDLVAGDTVVYLEDVSGWSKEWLLGTLLTVWNYKNSFGYQYAPEVYTRNYYPISRSGQYPTDDAIDAANNTVKLAQAYSGETIPAGTYVSQGYDGNGWGYKPCSNTIAPTEWTHFSAVIDPAYIRPGAIFTKYGFFWNDRSEDDQVWGTNFVLKELSDSVTTEEMNTAIANAIGTAIEGGY